VTWVGVPGCSAARTSAGAAKGCGRAVRRARLRPVAGRSPSSAQSSTPRPGDHRACTTNTPPPYDRPAAGPGHGLRSSVRAKIGRGKGSAGVPRESVRIGPRM
jgi:hypothetical protein